MYIVMNRLEVPAEQAGTFESHFSGNMTSTLGDVPGLHRAALLRPHRDEDPYVAVMEFTDETAFRNWVTSDAFRAAHGHGPREGGEPPSVASYEVVTEVTNPA